MTKEQYLDKALAFYTPLESGEILSHWGRPLKPQLKGGRHTVTLHVDGGLKTIYVHQVIAYKFIGPAKGRTVNHKDCNKLNNAANNLEYLSMADNQRHYWRTSRNPRPARTKLSWEKVAKLRKLHSEGYQAKQLQYAFGLKSYRHVLDILHNKAWPA